MNWGTRLGAAVLGVALAFAIGVGCRDEGPMERAGATIDEKIDEASDGAAQPDGDFQKVGRNLDAASAEAREKIEEGQERAEND